MVVPTSPAHEMGGVRPRLLDWAWQNGGEGGRVVVHINGGTVFPR